MAPEQGIVFPIPLIFTKIIQAMQGYQKKNIAVTWNYILCSLTVQII